MSLLLPLAAVILVMGAGLAAIGAARGVLKAGGGGRGWLGVLVASTIVGVTGPLVAAVVWRDAPDALVVMATALLGGSAAVVLAHGVWGPGRGANGPESGSGQGGFVKRRDGAEL